MAATAGFAIAAMSSIGGAITQAQAAKTQGEFSRQQAERNARLAEQQAEQAEQQGEKEANIHRQKVRALVGSQRAAQAAQGIDVGSGSALELQEQTTAFGEQDATQIRLNAYRQAFGFREQGRQERAQGQFDYAASRNEARNTLLTGGLQAAGQGLQAYGAYQSSKAPIKSGGVGKTNKSLGRGK